MTKTQVVTVWQPERLRNSYIYFHLDCGAQFRGDSTGKYLAKYLESLGILIFSKFANPAHTTFNHKGKHQT